MSMPHFLRFQGPVLFAAALCLVWAAPAVAWNATAVRVLSGDSLVAAKTSGVRVKVCLYGIRAPDPDSGPGERARSYAALAAEGRTICVSQRFVSRNGCRVGIVSFPENGASLNERMLRAGFARVDRRGCGLRICGEWFSVEQQARRDNAGLWAETAADRHFSPQSRKPGEAGEMFRCPACELR
jgi:endonuclease YncB( thermonuclease family)